MVNNLKEKVGKCLEHLAMLDRGDGMCQYL